MRILGEKDYYDSAMGLGSDETRIYIRPKPEVISSKVERDTIKEKRGRHWQFSSKVENPEYEKLEGVFAKTKVMGVNLPEIILDWDSREYRGNHPVGINNTIYFGTLFFCGKMHRFAYVHNHLGRGVLPSLHGTSAVEVFYSVDSLYEFAERLPKGRICQRGKYWWEGGRRTVLDEEVIRERLESFFGEFTHPPIEKYLSVVKRGESIVVNPILKNLQFQKVLDPTTAFQTVEQYLYGVLGESEKETVNISDKDRIQQHGFDKHSFRKLPTKKR